MPQLWVTCSSTQAMIFVRRKSVSSIFTLALSVIEKNRRRHTLKFCELTILLIDPSRYWSKGLPEMETMLSSYGISNRAKIRPGIGAWQLYAFFLQHVCHHFTLHALSPLPTDSTVGKLYVRPLARTKRLRSSSTFSSHSYRKYVVVPMFPIPTGNCVPKRRRMPYSSSTCPYITTSMMH